MNLDQLNPEQRKAVETLEGPVLILAGAGSGKTRALTYRVANLISKGVPASEILALTFTNKAADEMLQRINSMSKGASKGAWISTFHSMSAWILRENIDKLGYSRNFSIYDAEDQTKIVRDILKQKNIDDKTHPPRDIKNSISDAKNKFLDPLEWFNSTDKNFRDQTVYEIFLEYEKQLRTANALDFDDLIFYTLKLFKDFPSVLEKYQQRFSYIHVDEYQDTNYSQYKLVQLLTGDKRNICVVGDDDQSIYGWRGADLRNILDFEKDYPDATIIKLEQNYRSSGNILKAANQVISNNEERKEKLLWTELPEGSLIKIFEARDERGEAAWICDRIQQLNLSGESLGDVAILYRNNAQSRILELMLARAGISYRVFGGPRFYDRKEIRDIIAFLRVITNPSDNLSLLRIINRPKRSIGDSTINVLVNYSLENSVSVYEAVQVVPPALSARPRKCVTDFSELLNRLKEAKSKMSLSEFVEFLIDETGLRAQYKDDRSEEARDRIENMDEFLGAVKEFEISTSYQTDDDASPPTLESFLENIALITELDQAEQSDQHVTLMTIHCSKGLEFPIVFLSGMEEGLFPSARTMMEESGLEEERRLCYVGITRAKERLFMSYAKRRMLYNQLHQNEPSRFITEISDELLDREMIAKMERSFGKGSAVSKRVKRTSQVITGPLESFGVPQVVIPPPPIDANNPLNIAGVQKGASGLKNSSSPAKSLHNSFLSGDRVIHKKFGEGNVVEISGTGNNAFIVIEFAAYGEKKFALHIAPIVKIQS